MFAYEFYLSGTCSNVLVPVITTTPPFGGHGMIRMISLALHVHMESPVAYSCKLQVDDSYSCRDILKYLLI